MAALFIFQTILHEKDQPLRRERVFRDRTQVLDTMTDEELITRYRFPSHVIWQLVDAVREEIEPDTIRSHAIPAHIQVMYDSTTFQHVIGSIQCKRKVKTAVNHICAFRNDV